MWNKIFLVFNIVFYPAFLLAQDCNLSISGQVIDSLISEPLEFVSIYLTNADQGVTTDATGHFEFTNLCPGDFELVFSHVGCTPIRKNIELVQDVELAILMAHTTHQLENVLVLESAEENTTQQSSKISSTDISEAANENLSNILESISGVSTLRNGSGISKPIIHGLYGNRLPILNNGIAQSGQQWGNDHSPEIDPWVAGQIRVIKGVSVLEYPGTNFGSLVLVEPKKIELSPKLIGKTNFFIESNGRGSGLNVQLQKYSPIVSWKINGTLKKSGDNKSASYFLRNSGSQEANVAIQLERVFSEYFFVDFYFSSFNADLGVLRGAHVGNVTDLEDAFVREIPLYTESNFSYVIDAPRQQVNHQLLKVHSNYFFTENSWIDISFAGQLNTRKEFDIRRGNRSDIPALSLTQFNLFGEGKYQHNFNTDWKLNTGVQFNFIDNTNNPETGILPLIPDYFSYQTGIYSTLKKEQDFTLFEFGIRYDHVLQKVVTISSGINKEIIRYTNNFNNLSASSGFAFKMGADYNLVTNLGYATRNPAINELYSLGLHQGVSGIEEGSIDLNSEHSFKYTLGFSRALERRVSFDVQGYYHFINDYITLIPQNEFRLTIRGAFPVFKYEQTDAQIFGIDFTGNVRISEQLNARMTYSFIKGKDRTNSIPLIYIPANNISAQLIYSLSGFECSIENRYVFEQKNFTEQQDFLAPPAGYNLLNLKFAKTVELNKSKLKIVLKIDNVFNVAYRDYLNRQRYFADDLGINGILGINYSF